MGLPKETERYTYTDYCTWDDGARWELIDGVPYMMAPAPSDSHQSICGSLYTQLAVFLKGKPCKVRLSPYDVRLNADSGDDNVVQPDIVVICDSLKITSGGCVGAPDMAIEIVSPSSSRRDRLEKYRLYEKFGVREYWVVDPDSRTVQVHILRDGIFGMEIYGDQDAVPVHVLDGCQINLSEIFEE